MVIENNAKNIMGTITLKDYIKQLSDLECSVYKQEEMTKEIDRNTYYIQPTKQGVKMPSKQEVKKPEKPIKPNVEIPPKFDERIIKFIIMFAFGVFILVRLFTSDYISGEAPIYIGVPLVFIGMIGTIYYISAGITNHNKAVEQEKLLTKEYETKLNYYNLESPKYEKRLREAEKKYNKAMEQFEIDSKKADETYALEIKKADESFNNAKAIQSDTHSLLEQTKKNLNQLYSADIIFPKYRNMIAMSTMYEYFATGRVDCLEGPNGAYNLYESELRQNMIIGQLDAITSNLEQIRQNQYTLYNELKTTNEMVYAVGKEIGMIAKGVKNIESTSYIAAKAAEITAVNTNAIAMIGAMDLIVS